MKNIPVILFSFFVLIHDPAGDRAASYDGMDQATVARLVAETGFPFDFIDQAAYDAFVAAHRPVPPTSEQLTASRRATASAELTSSTQGLTVLQKSVLLLIMDEINLLRQRNNDLAADVAAATSLADLKARWASHPAMADRTGAQLKTAIQNKITGGQGD